MTTQARWHRRIWSAIKRYRPRSAHKRITYIAECAERRTDKLEQRVRKLEEQK